MTDVVANCVSDKALVRHFQEDPRVLATWEVLCQPRWQIASVATSFLP